MTLAMGMILVAALLPYGTVAFAKAAGGVDNRAPRLSEERLTGRAQRADWAHRNHFEAFAPFAAAVIVAQLAQVPQARIDALAVAFVAARVIYTWAYVDDRASLRSSLWGAGFACVVALFVLAAFA
jgi:uncharacterized MAPEG superfamily protein